ASLVAYLDDGTAETYAECEQVAVALATGEGWVETKIDLSEHAGKTLKAIGLKVEGDVADYQINLGRIAVLDKARAALNGPASFILDEIMYTDAYTAEARIQWAKVTGAASYEIYKVNGETKTLIMETPSTAFYVPTLKRDASETDVTIEIVPINRNGVRGKGTQFVIDWLYGNDDSDEVVVHNFENVALNAEVTGVSFENSGEPASKALDGTAANNSKWCATNYGSGWMTIDIGRMVTVKRWRVEHAEFGGEANNMNTIDFALEYKDPASNSWVQVKRIQNNHAAVTDVLLDTPITAQEWKLQVYDDGSSPWGGIRIYEWQMFESDQFPQTDVVPMHFASAVNAVGANDTFTLKNVPAGVTVKVYNAAGEKLGEQVAGESAVVISGLDFGAEAGRVYYTTTGSAAAESAKLSAAFEAESAEKSAAAEDVSFVAYSHPGSVTSSNGNDIYTTLTVNGLEAGDVVYVYENGADADYTKASLPVAEGKTSVSIDRILVTRAGGELTLRVKRVGKLISDAYTVATPAFAEPTATVQVFAKNAAGETLTGVRFEVVGANGEVAAQMSTTSDSGAKAEVELGTYTIRNVESPEGYGLATAAKAILRIEGELKVLTVIVPTGSVEPTDPTDPVEPTDPTDPPVVVDPADDSRDIPLEVLTVSTGNYQTGYEDSEGPAELAVDNNPNTIWHTDWYGTSRDDHWFQFEINGDYNVDGLRILPRQTGNTNGIITEYDIQVSEDGETFFSITSGEWAADREWKLVQFPAAHVKYVRMYALDGVTDNAYVFASAAEIRLTGAEYVAPPAESNLALNAEIVAYNGTKMGDEAGPEKLFNGSWSDENADKWCEDGKNLWVAFDLGQESAISSISVYHAGANNEWMPDGASTNTEAYELYTLNTELISYEELLEKSFEERTDLLGSSEYWVLVDQVSGNTDDITTHEVDLPNARIFKFNVSDTDTTNWAACVRVYEIEVIGAAGAAAPETADKTELNALIAECELIEKGNYTNQSWNEFQKALSRARTVAASPYADQAKVDEAVANLAAARDGLKEKVVGEGPQKILHLDSGRKYFSKDWHIALLNELAAAGYTHVQLAFGNNGFRFLLDDMTIEANGTTYASDDIKEGVRIGNYNYGALTGYYTDDAHALTEAEMDEIIAHGKSVGVEIIPH
ncbi:MAG: discoidin domain-containing protein, partial [Oscillospiraceae bacterium]|nr:discoidin domain-containing protein [Oscillospiraceae bacterium]